MIDKRPDRLTELRRAFTDLGDNALLDAWKAAVTIRDAAKSTRSRDDPGLRAAICESVAEKRFGPGRHVALYVFRHGKSPEA